MDLVQLRERLAGLEQQNELLQRELDAARAATANATPTADERLAALEGQLAEILAAVAPPRDKEGRPKGRR